MTNRSSIIVTGWRMYNMHLIIDIKATRTQIYKPHKKYKL